MTILSKWFYSAISGHKSFKSYLKETFTNKLQIIIFWHKLTKLRQKYNFNSCLWGGLRNIRKTECKIVVLTIDILFKELCFVLELEISEEAAGPMLEENLVLDLMDTSERESGEEPTVIYEDFEDYEEKYQPQEGDLNIVISEVFSQSDCSSSKNFSKDRNFKNHSPPLSKNIQSMSYYERKFGLQSCSVVLERCSLAKNVKASNKSSTSPPSKTSNVGIASCYKTDGTTNLDSNRKDKRKIANSDTYEDVSLSKLIKLNLSSIMEKSHTKGNEKLDVQGNGNFPVFTLPSSLNELSRQTNLLESLVVHENIAPNNSVIFQENNNILKRTPNQIVVTQLPLPANDGSSLETEKDEKCLNQISKSNEKESKEVFNMKYDFTEPLSTQNKTLSSLIASISVTNSSFFGYLPSNCKIKLNVSDQGKLLPGLTNGTFNFKSLLFDGQSARNFMLLKNMFAPINMSQIIHPVSINSALQTSKLTLNPALAFSPHSVQEMDISNQRLISLPKARIVEIDDILNNSLDVTSNAASPNSNLDNLHSNCSKQNAESKENVVSSQNAEAHSTTETIQNVEHADPIPQLLSQFFSDISKLPLNSPKTRADEIKNECTETATTESLPNRFTGYKQELSLTLRKRPVKTFDIERTYSNIGKLSKLTRRPSLETKTKPLCLRRNTISTCMTQTLPQETEPALQQSRCPVTNSNPQGALSGEQMPLSTNIPSFVATNTIDTRPALSCKPKQVLNLKTPDTISKPQLSLSLTKSKRHSTPFLEAESYSTLLSSHPSTSQTENKSRLESENPPLRRSPIKARKKKVMSYLEWECLPTKAPRMKKLNSLQSPNMKTGELKESKKVVLMSNGESLHSSSIQQENNGPPTTNEGILEIPEKTEYCVTKTYLKKRSIPDAHTTVHSYSYLVNPTIQSPASKGSNMLALEQKPTSNKIETTQNQLVTDTKTRHNLSLSKFETSQHTLNPIKKQKLDLPASNSLMGENPSPQLEPPSRKCPNNREPQHRKSKVCEGKIISLEESQTPKDAGTLDRKSLVTKDQARKNLPSEKSSSLSEMLDSAPPFIQEVFTCSNIADGFINSDLVFVLSLLPDMEEMTPSQKHSFQLKVIELMTNVLDDPTLQIEMQR